MRQLFTACLLFLAAIAFSQDYTTTARQRVDNYTGWYFKDTISDTLEADTVKYTDAFNLSQAGRTRILWKIQDTSSAGHASDSIELEVGVQVGLLTLDSAGNLDTAWDGPHILLDTLTGSSYGNTTDATVDSTGTITYPKMELDTSYVTGFAQWQRDFSPPWAGIWRAYAKGMTDNNADGDLICVFEAHREEGDPVKVSE